MINLINELSCLNFKSEEEQLKSEILIIEKRLHVLNVLNVEKELNTLISGMTIQKFKIKQISLNNITSSNNVSYSLFNEKGAIKVKKIDLSIRDPKTNKVLFSDIKNADPYGSFDKIFKPLTWFNREFISSSFYSENTFQYDKELPEKITGLLLSDELMKSLMNSKLNLKLNLEVPRKEATIKTIVKV